MRENHDMRAGIVIDGRIEANQARTAFAPAGSNGMFERVKARYPRRMFGNEMRAVALICMVGGLLFQTSASGQQAPGPVVEEKPAQVELPAAGPAVEDGAAAQAEQPAADIAGVAGTMTRGGLVNGTKIIHVTSLADHGEGTLRAALAGSSPRIIVFDVGGTIELESYLRIGHPFVTVAGQTAPSPGILLRGDKLRIATHDVVVQHISVRPGRQDPVPDNADGISIGPCTDCRYETRDIRLENISVSWAIDENIGLWGETVFGITIRNSIIAEALDRAGHEKGGHSMGILIGQDVKSVEVVGNLFVSNNFRNPVMGARTSTFVANNYVYNPGGSAIHIYKGAGGTRATIIGNVVKRGPNSRREMTALQWQGDFAKNYQGALVFENDNHCCSGSTRDDAVPYPKTAQLATAPPVESRTWTVMPASEVWNWVDRHAGSRPAERQPIDSRIVAFVRYAVGAIIDDPAQVGGYLGVSVTAQAPAVIPDKPFAIAGTTEKTRIEAWLCLRHLQVGGGQTPECSESAAELEEALFGGD
ncbi:MAG: hypothetical protein Q8P46_11630 [Hyphomicrobiales bacterium]|nr:hypothetical protein [Hyphomicrobiales bacterium]